MKQYELTYFERGSLGEKILHKETYITKVAAKINLFLSSRNKNREVISFKEVES